MSNHAGLFSGGEIQKFHVQTQSPLAPQATSVGQAVAGFAVSVLSFLTTWAALVPEPGEERGPRDVAVTAFAYFGLSAAVVVASMAGYWMLQLIPFWLRHTSSHSGHGISLTQHTPVLQCKAASVGRQNKMSALTSCTASRCTQDEVHSRCPGCREGEGGGHCTGGGRGSCEWARHSGCAGSL